MIASILQTVALAGASWLLYFLCLRFSGAGRARFFVAAGFLLRALAGQVLFWISYLRLPVARSLQVGDGLWFFALDAEYFIWVVTNYIQVYLPSLSAAVKAIIMLPRTLGSVVFIQTLSVFMGLFGKVTSVGLLLNLFCYLATCALIVRWGSAGKQASPAATLAVAALALSPSAILWSLQPLKDSLFIFLVVGFLFACVAWQRGWTVTAEGRAGFPWRGLVMTALAMGLTMYGIAGLRWYVAAVALTASAFFFLLVAANARGRRIPALIAGVIMVAFLSRIFVGSGDTYIPLPIQRVLDPRTMFLEIGSLGRSVLGIADKTRTGFERTGGATIISAGSAIAAAPSGDDSRMPSSRLGRLMTGWAALSLPRTVAQSLGIIEIGGGRGLWVFVEFDTLIFDALVVAVVIFSFRSIRGASFRNPIFWLILLFLLLLAVPLIYTVANFGTLFRQRLMIYVALVLIPLALSTPEIDRQRQLGSQQTDPLTDPSVKVVR